MKQQKTTTARKGTGTLFKKKDGKRYKPTARIRAPFYHTVSTTVNGKRKDTTRRLADENGEPVYDRKLAEEIRDRLTRPVTAKSELRKEQEICDLISHKQKQVENAMDDAIRPLRLVDVWKVYVDSPNRKKCSQQTLSICYAPIWKRLNKWLTEVHPEISSLDQVTPEEAREYARLLTDNLSGRTFNGHIAFLKKMFRELDEEAKLKGASPFAKIASAEKETVDRRALTIDEVKQLIESAGQEENQEYLTLFMVGTFTGLRLYDCATLRWNEVDLVRRVIIRIPHKTARVRKNNKKPKTVKIGIPVALLAHLESLKQNHETLCPTLAAEYIHPSQKNRVARSIRRIFKRANITKRFEKSGRNRAGVDAGFHSLRHTFISLHAEAGAASKLIQATVGHSSAKQTLDYTHPTDKAALTAADNFPMTLDVEAVEEPIQDAKEPLPAWAVKLVRSATNLDELKDKLLKGQNEM